VTDGGIRRRRFIRILGVSASPGERSRSRKTPMDSDLQVCGLRVAEVAKLIKLGMKLSQETKAI